MGASGRPTQSIRMFPVKVHQECRVRQVGRGDPAPVHWAVSLPVNKILETTPTTTYRQELPDGPYRIAILEDTGRWRGGDKG